MDRRKTLDTSLFFIISLIFLLSCSSSNAQSACSSYRFTSNNVFANCSSLPALGSFLHWTYDEATGTVSIAFRRPGTSSSTWVCWGLNPSGQRMLGTQSIIAFTNSSGQFQAYTSPITSYSTPVRGDLSFGVSRVSASLVGGEAIIFATLELPANMIQTNQVWQEGPVSNGVPQVHQMTGDNGRSVGRINFRSGQATAAGGGGGGGLSDRQRKRNIHGVLNAVSWGVLMPLGAIMARYVKVFADPAWFYLHIACQFSGYVVGVAGWATGIKLGNDSPGTSYSIHRNIGIALFVFGTLQAFAVLLRPKPDHKYRFYWNIYHHSIGYSTIILSIINIFKGLDILDVEDKWRWAYIGILIFLGACVLLLEPLTWFIVLRRKRTTAGGGRGGVADKHSSHGNGATQNGSHQVV